MKSILELYKIGAGPNSAINLVPYLACKEVYGLIVKTFDKIHHVDVDLYNEYAKTAKELDVEQDIKAGFKGASFPIRIHTDMPVPPAARAPFTFDVIIYGTEKDAVGRHRVVSTGGGSYLITDNKKQPKYQFESFEEISKFFKTHTNMSYMDFACLFDKREDIEDHFRECIKLMDTRIDDSFKKTGALKLKDKNISYERRAKIVLDKKGSNESQTEKVNRLISAFAYAIGEEIPEKNVVVGSPTISTSPVVWSVLRYLRETYKPSEEKIFNALVAAGLLGSLVERHGDISTINCGCQGQMATACGMAACIASVILYDAKIDELGRCVEMAIEHALGLICNSVCAIPIVPCIQRTAAYALRAYEIAILNHSLMKGDELVKLDDAITVMFETGKDLLLKNKRWGTGGYAQYAEYSIYKNACQKK